MTPEARILHARSGATLEQRTGPDGVSYAVSSLRFDDVSLFSNLDDAQAAFEAEAAASETDPEITAMLGGS